MPCFSTRLSVGLCFSFSVSTSVYVALHHRYRYFCKSAYLSVNILVHFVQLLSHHICPSFLLFSLCSLCLSVFFPVTHPSTRNSTKSTILHLSKVKLSPSEEEAHLMALGSIEHTHICVYSIFTKIAMFGK